MHYFDDVYSSPENYGLKIVGEIEWTDGCYQFDRTVLWVTEDGTLYWGNDSGCSCPSPFEGYKSFDQLTSGTKWQFLQYIKDLVTSRLGADTRAQYADLAGKVAAL
jgi:hypothetical protein